MPDAEVPGELGAILNAIKNAARGKMTNEAVAALIGNMFCLRFLAPTLTQAQNYIKIKAKLQRVVLTLSKLLQMISNQVEPDSAHEFFDVAEQMRLLQIDLIGMHNRLAAVPGRNVLVVERQIENAIELYKRVLTLAEEMGSDEIEVLSLRELLGPPDDPRYAEIERRRQQIGKLNPDAL